MKANFRKSLVVAGIATAMTGMSANSLAAINGDAGEAFLVPFAIWNDGIPNASELDTIVQLTIPSTVGAKSIPNQFTAVHTTPRGKVGITPIEMPTDETPFAVFVADPEQGLHWYFMDYRSDLLRSGFIPVTPEDHYTYSLRQQTNSSPELNNQPGYLIFTTEQGAAQQAADFAFFADAYLTADNTGDPNGPGTLTPYSYVSWELPALAMPDGADAGGFTQDNQVVEATEPFVEVRPLHSGISTWFPGAATSARKVIDLAVADRTVTAVPAGYTPSSLLVVWNDSNLATWGSIFANLFNTDEFSCNVPFRAPNELNLTWFPKGENTQGGFRVNATAPAFVNYKKLDFPPVGTTLRFASCVGGFDSLTNDNDAFIRLQLPLESASTDVDDRTAAYAFSLQVWASTATGSSYLVPKNNYGAFADNDGLSNDDAYPQSAAHDRGVFATSGNAWQTP